MESWRSHLDGSMASYRGVQSNIPARDLCFGRCAPETKMMLSTPTEFALASGG
jgi:hypothetical protein